MIYRPGDCLLYGPSGFFGHAIAIKTWMKVAHVEVYAGDGASWASRNGEGVALYTLRTEKLVDVLRPVQTLDFLAMQDWFETVDGQAYDWFGLTRFLFWGSTGFGNNGKQFCSEFATRLYRAGGMDPFAGCDADAVAPATFLFSNCFTRVPDANRPDQAGPRDDASAA